MWIKLCHKCKIIVTIAGNSHLHWVTITEEIDLVREIWRWERHLEGKGREVCRGYVGAHGRCENQRKLRRLKRVGRGGGGDRGARTWMHSHFKISLARMDEKRKLRRLLFRPISGYISPPKYPHMHEVFTVADPSPWVWITKTWMSTMKYCTVVL